MKVNKIYNMDCLEGMKQLKDNSVDLIITDPPYNIGKDFVNDNLNKEDYINWCFSSDSLFEYRNRRRRGESFYHLTYLHVSNIQTEN